VVVYPPNTYKGNKDKYILPLTDTLIEIIKFFKMIYYKSDYVFRESNVREETLSNRLKDYYIKLGIKEHTRHGWRSAFKTILTEMKVGSFESIEKQLGHRIGNEVNMSYFRSDMIDERREILKFWEDFLYNRIN
jgi:integrase